MDDDLFKEMLDRFDNMSPEEQEEIYKQMTRLKMEYGEAWLDSLDDENEDG